jgi:transcriptional activator Myb
LKNLVQTYGENAWHRICKYLPNKTEIKCFQRWLDFKQVDDM